MSFRRPGDLKPIVDTELKQDYDQMSLSQLKAYKRDIERAIRRAKRLEKPRISEQQFEESFAQVFDLANRGQMIKINRYMPKYLTQTADFYLIFYWSRFISIEELPHVEYKVNRSGISDTTHREFGHLMNAMNDSGAFRLLPGWMKLEEQIRDSQPYRKLKIRIMDIEQQVEKWEEKNNFDFHMDMAPFVLQYEDEITYQKAFKKAWLEYCFVER